MSDDILIKQDGPILRITLNRPDHGNGATDPMALALTEALLKAGETSRLVVLNANGKDFCVGRATMGQRPATLPEAILRRRQSEVIFNSYAAFRAATVPVIAVVRGLAAGYGCAIAGVADITIAAESATFQIPEMAHNIMPTMVMSALMDRVSRKDLFYLTYSTAIISAARAREAGIVSEFVPDGELDIFVAALCKRIIDTPKLATDNAKEYLRRAFTMDVPSAVDYARNIHAVINSSKEMWD
ncbi:MAG TPA: enoyl-CoA hydratase/isomerase family protein [Xanthobacteraceae bacterium]|nr:enoyl-CoA hydratase/isomerase family protein [Xanthobacteraceae bacterium]